MNKNTADIRKDYIFDRSNNLSEKDILPDPVKQFEKWFGDALALDEHEANAMFLATSAKDAKPSLRTVLLKGYDESGFIFFTNYSSRKGSELEENPNASILFFWKELGRQIRIEGTVTKVSREVSDAYFHSRPLDSQIAALSSAQSNVIESREALDSKFSELKEKYKDGKIPLPENWGGYRLIPERMEFWQGRQNRLHDRILYSKEKNGVWKINRLAP
ncbi:MAG: pyridoxamine 5'-phosphate oxidase [bacterium]